MVRFVRFPLLAQPRLDESAQEPFPCLRRLRVQGRQEVHQLVHGEIHPLGQPKSIKITGGIHPLGQEQDAPLHQGRGDEASGGVSILWCCSSVNRSP